MMQWLRKSFSAAPPAVLPPAGPPDWAVEFTDLLTKATRSATRQGLKLDELQSRMDAGFDDLRQALRSRPSATKPPDIDWLPLCDAADLLTDLALQALSAGNRGLGEGLLRVLGRLDGQLAVGGIARHTGLGQPPDGRLVQVVTAEARPDVPPGLTIRLVRSAVLRGQQLVRAGEVVVSAQPTPPSAGAGDEEATAHADPLAVDEGGEA